eukprot:GHVN01015097.1.p1 GENE.GHVN01015097.1~~GHVN01015097.1.p1  ORF type:complete len:254 (+),score=69.49 GHVN01015097.1:258-1019(+)
MKKQANRLASIRSQTHVTEKSSTSPSITSLTSTISLNSLSDTTDKHIKPTDLPKYQQRQRHKRSPHSNNITKGEQQRHTGTPRTADELPDAERASDERRSEESVSVMVTNDNEAHLDPLGGNKTVMLAVVAYSAGVCSGLLGIGGGLIISPYLLAVMKHLPPLSVVSTSAMCVLFTSTSTTAQYLLLGRINIGFAIFFGSAAMIGASMGLKLIRWINERYNERSSVLFVVAAAIGVSSVLTMVKAVTKLNQPE